MPSFFLTCCFQNIADFIPGMLYAEYALVETVVALGGTGNFIFKGHLLSFLQRTSTT